MLSIYCRPCGDDDPNAPVGDIRASEWGILNGVLIFAASCRVRASPPLQVTYSTYLGICLRVSGSSKLKNSSDQRIRVKQGLVDNISHHRNHSLSHPGIFGLDITMAPPPVKHKALLNVDMGEAVSGHVLI